MASTDLAAAEAEWRQQFAAMRAALAEIKIPQGAKEVGDEDGFDDQDFESFSPRESGHDVWDFISDDEDENDGGYSSDFVEPAHISPGRARGFGVEWLADKCFAIAGQNGLSADVFQSQILSVLTSGRSEDELQAELTDLVGFDDLDFVIELLSHKDDVVADISAQTHKEQTGHRLLTKSQREEALRRQDQEHKSTALASSYSRAPQYPHVYKAHDAGNTLSATGKKYGLPAGSERLLFEKYEEYFVPAGRKGTLGPGQRLINISDMDGLCRGTFKGYQSLNRMQSLVYPVAYKTSENMLICAPTGAVS